jgi:hypothetical protein
MVFMDNVFVFNNPVCPILVLGKWKLEMIWVAFRFRRDAINRVSTMAATPKTAPFSKIPAIFKTKKIHNFHQPQRG